MCHRGHIFTAAALRDPSARIQGGADGPGLKHRFASRLLLTRSSSLPETGAAGASANLLHPGLRILREAASLRIKSRPARTLADQSENYFGDRHSFARKHAEFDDGAKHRINLHRPSALQILQHRCLVRSDLGGAGNSLINADRKAYA